MASKAHPTTIRLTDADQTFLASLKITGASTISDKIRGLIDDRRLLEEAGRDYQSALALANMLLAPLQTTLKIAEREQGVHSQLVRRVVELTPDLLAVLLTEAPTDGQNATKASLESLEKNLTDQLLRLIDIALQSYIARDSALYKSSHLSSDKIFPLQRLCRLMDHDNTNN